MLWLDMIRYWAIIITKPIGTQFATQSNESIYRTYLFTGGMPFESVSNMLWANGDYIKYDKGIFKWYIRFFSLKIWNKYVTSDVEALKR